MKWQKLLAYAKEQETLLAKMPKIMVQVGHCSRGLGVEVLMEKLSHQASSYRVVEVGCDGACFNAPQIIISKNGLDKRIGKIDPSKVTVSELIDSLDEASDHSEIDAFFRTQHRIVIENCGFVDPGNIYQFIAKGGYSSLYNCLQMDPEEVLTVLETSKLRGRGGAYFPVALKWKSARSFKKEQRYIVANGEEGEPGIYKDRHLMEGDPHRIIEGMVIAGYVSGAAKGYIYINAEADISKKRIDDAIAQALENGLLGSRILGTGFSFDLEVRQGAGGYVCGEETTLLNTIEGDRRVPRLRPPFPTESGLWSRPTVINNIETLAFIPTIIADGGEKFCQVGTSESPGTKLFSLSGAIQRTGLVEMPLGTSVGQLIYDIGGGALPDRSIVAAAVGGPSSGMLPTKLFDSQLVPPVVHSSGVVLGAGGVVAIDDQIPILEVIRNLAMYNAVESCGKCTPCREGTPRIVTIIDNLLNKKGKKADLTELKFLADLLPVSLCGLGQMAGNVVTNSLELFKSELDEGLKTS